MKQEAQSKESIRKHVIDVAIMELRENGILGAGLKELAIAAKMRQGSFYYYFQSKEHLVQEAIVAAISEQRNSWRSSSASEGDIAFEIASQLSDTTKSRAIQMMAAIAPEIERLSIATRQKIEGELEQLLGQIAGRLSSGSTLERRSAAITIYSLLIGAIQLSRGVTSAELSLAILASARTSATRIAAATD